MDPITFEPLRTLRLDLPGAALGVATTAAGRVAALTAGMQPGTLLLASWSLHLDRDLAGDDTPRRADALVQLAAQGPAQLLAHPWREQVLVAAQDAGADVLYALDLLEARPLWRVVLEGRRTTPVVPHPRGWLFGEAPGVLNLLDHGGEDAAMVQLEAPLQAAPVVLPDGQVVAATGRDLFLIDLRTPEGPHPRLALPAPPRALAAGPGDTFAAALPEAVLLWPRGLRQPPAQVPTGPTVGGLLHSPRGGLFTALPEDGLLHLDPARGMALRWAEGITCQAFHLDYSGAVLALGAYDDARGLLLAFPPTPPDARHPASATPLPLPAPPVDAVVSPEGLTLLCADGTLLRLRVLVGGGEDLLMPSYD